MNQPNGGWQPPQGGQSFGQPAQPPMQPQQQYAPGPPVQQQHQQPPPVAPGTQMPPGVQQQGMPAPGQQMPQGMGVPDQGNPFSGMNSGDQSGGARHPFLGGAKDGPSLNGDYKLKIAGLKFIRTRSGNKPQYIIEAEILESNQPERPVGMTCSIFIDLSNQDTGWKHLAAFLASVYGYESAKLEKDSLNAPWGMAWTDAAMASIQSDQPVVGMEVGCHATQIALRNGNPWTLHTWAPASTLVIPPTPPPLAISENTAPIAGQVYAQQLPPQQQYAPQQGQPPPQQQYAPQQGQPPPQQQYAPQQGPQQQGLPQPPQPQGGPPVPQGGPPAPPPPTGSWSQ